MYLDRELSRVLIYVNSPTLMHVGDRFIYKCLMKLNRN